MVMNCRGTYFLQEVWCESPLKCLFSRFWIPTYENYFTFLNKYYQYSIRMELVHRNRSCTVFRIYLDIKKLKLKLEIGKHNSAHFFLSWWSPLPQALQLSQHSFVLLLIPPYFPFQHFILFLIQLLLLQTVIKNIR